MSRFRDLRPHEPLPPKPSRKKASASARPPAAPAPPPPPPTPAERLGPRPVSARQQAHRDKQTAPPPPGPAPIAHKVRSSSGSAGASGSGVVRHVRDAETTHPRVRVKANAKRTNTKPRNRKRGNLPKTLLLWASGVLAVECIGALLFSPRLWVRRVVVEGNQNVAAQSLIGRLGLGEHDNIVRLHTQKLRAAILAEPRIGTVEIHRQLPDTVRVVVTERVPWACVQTADGTCYVIDRDLVPFRKEDIPPVGLPLLKLQGAKEKVALGQTMTARGLNQVSKCLAWAKARADFPLDAISIDEEGKLCLNRAGGAKILLGSGSDLDKKLHSLETLLAQRAELRDATRVAYVNLFAYDAPAVSLRTASHTTDPSGANSDGSQAGNAGAAVDLPSVTKASP